MTTATHRRRPADANDHRGRLSAGTLRGFQCGRIRLTQLAAAPTHRIHRLSRRQRPGRFAGWITGTCFVIALIVTVVAAVLQRTNVVQPLNTLRMVWIQVAGIIPATAGIAATVYAQLAMGDSWRIGVDEQENTTLVRTGPFKWVRHPIYTAMMAFGLGLLLVTPNLVALAGFILLVATLEVHVRRVEEPYLLRTHSAVYRGYTASVGRFVPGVGLIR